jgi:3-oxoacyl-[acyl-carrier-protein] synthase III
VKPFVLNRHGRLVFPSSFLPELDFSVLETHEQLEAVIKRDFEAKAPTGSEILERVEAHAYTTRYELLRDLTLNLLWVNRFAIMLYEKRPTRWRDVARRRDDLFLPVLSAWAEAERKIAAAEAAYASLPVSWDGETEDRIFTLLFDVFRHRQHDAGKLAAIKPTVAEFASDPSNLTFCLAGYDPDHPTFGYREIVDVREERPELESLSRLAMVLHNQYPWDRSRARLAAIDEIGDDEFVVVFAPRNREVLEFIRRVKERQPARRRPVAAAARQPMTPLPPVVVAERFQVLPRLESLTVIRGEHVCTNEDVIRNAAYNWSPMSADEILQKTGIEARRYTEHGLDQISLEAARDALAGASRQPDEIGAVIFCSCTSTRLIPSVATWLSGQLGIFQTHASCDVIAACAGFPYGLAEAVRLLQEVQRPVLVVFGEKFSDKIGSVRPSRMIFGDGAAAIVVAPAAKNAPADVEIVQTYASGPVSEVNSIIWPNPAFDNNITVYGPEVRALVQRYIAQMLEELRSLPRSDGAAPGSLLDSIDLVVPHQANKTMVTKLAAAAGLAPERLYFNIDKVGNVSAASIPLAIYDAVQEEVIDRPMRVFAPGFGAGAVAGYAVVRIDPAIIVPERRHHDESAGVSAPPPTSSDDVKEAFRN